MFPSYGKVPTLADVMNGGRKTEGRRTLSQRDREILWIRAGKKCENCKKKIDCGDMQAGHKTAASRGGKATLSNSVCLCYGCNKRQGTDSWATFQKKQGNKVTKTATSKTKKTSKKRTKRSRRSSGGMGLGGSPTLNVPEIKIPKMPRYGF